MQRLQDRGCPKSLSDKFSCIFMYIEAFSKPTGLWEWLYQRKIRSVNGPCKTACISSNSLPYVRQFPPPQKLPPAFCPDKNNTEEAGLVFAAPP
jgi:hypothetical protein